MADQDHPAGDKPSSGVSGDHTVREERYKRYWRENLNLMGVLLVIWFTVSYGFGILFRDILDNFSIGGAPLGFWFAQQGAIYVFVILIFVYSAMMNRIERKYDAEDENA
ncbi:DUF4212 domain-containing protein [Oceanicaulis sp. MMSF_3324]|uniref:DUF4212 domain-containing protein n=1 Tax=Oceanicaulis sp. MMSF_3324 TaxID=3046702 RepID=UPI00273FB177|nr:DUF4212 domain-containing protein [Oceanicaulis sp. MMSF_3324]